MARNEKSGATAFFSEPRPFFAQEPKKKSKVGSNAIGMKLEEKYGKKEGSKEDKELEADWKDEAGEAAVEEKKRVAEAKNAEKEKRMAKQVDRVFFFINLFVSLGLFIWLGVMFLQ